MYNLNNGPRDKNERREENKKRARKMTLVMGIVCAIIVLAMVAEVYLR